MSDPESLKAYYNEVIHCEGMPSFEQLPDQYKESLAKMQGFAQWALNNSVDHLCESFAERMDSGYNIDGLKVFVFVFLVTIAFLLLVAFN
jgi:hypothetical protein